MPKHRVKYFSILTFGVYESLYLYVFMIEYFSSNCSIFLNKLHKTVRWHIPNSGLPHCDDNECVIYLTKSLSEYCAENIRRLKVL